MLEENRDRGRIKWTAMMLTEHVQKLREWMDEDDYEERPLLGEFDLQLIQEEIELAYKSKCQVLIKIWSDGHLEKHRGIIEGIDFQLMMIALNVSPKLERISVKDIVGVQNIT